LTTFKNVNKTVVASFFISLEMFKEVGGKLSNNKKAKQLKDFFEDK
jgi:hypothetical protein